MKATHVAVRMTGLHPLDDTVLVLQGNPLAARLARRGYKKKQHLKILGLEVGIKSDENYLIHSL